MNYVEQLIERGRREGRQEGRLELAQAIDGLLERDVPWSVVEAATGIDEAGFCDLKRHAATLRRAGRLDLELDQDGLSELRRQR